MKDLGKSTSVDSNQTDSSGINSDSNDSLKAAELDDEQYKMTEQLVDKHLNELKKKCMSYDTHDVIKFMEKLKNDQKTFEYENLEMIIPQLNGGKKSSESEGKSESDSPKVSSDEKPEKEDKNGKAEKEEKNGKNGSKDEDKDKKLTSNHIHVKSNRKSSLSPQGSVRKPKTIDLDAYTSSSSGDNQVQIVKIKSSPCGSRKTSRSNSIEREGKEKQNLKRPEGGILKKPSPKFEKANNNNLKTPDSLHLRPDRFISPASSFESKSDKLSPSSEILPNICVIDTHTDGQPHSLSDFETHASPHASKYSSPRSRSLDCSMEQLKSALKPNQSHYENVSPDRSDKHKYYSISAARDSFELNRTRSPIRYCSPINIPLPPIPAASVPIPIPPPSQQHYYNEPFYEYPAQRGHRKRESRSLERPPYMRQNSLEYERFYEPPPERRYSEYDPRIQHHYYSRSPDDYLSHSYEQPRSACVDCFYQNYHHHFAHSQQPPPPLPQRNQPQTSSSSQKATSTSSSSSRQRQSRSRKKMSRRMSSNAFVNYFNKPFDDEDPNANNYATIQSNTNDEIHV
jgi:hypothetical protein